MKSTMKAALCFVVFSLGSVATDMAGECAMASFYLELGCTPAPCDNSTCPDAFTCPDLHPNKSMCYYRGSSYGDRSPIPQSLIRNPCSQACSCRVSGGEPKFDCATVDCVEIFRGDLEKQCINIYELDSCCSTDTVCGKDEIAKLKQCEVDGQMYYEGQTFEPKKTRKTCICTPDWDGNVGNSSFCNDINCGLEIHYQDNILDNCAPVFAGSDRTCPISFICPSNTTKVVRGLNIRNINAQCVFGNETLTVGDELSVDDKCINCICKVPPFVTCSRKNVCGAIIE